MADIFGQCAMLNAKGKDGIRYLYYRRAVSDDTADDSQFQRLLLAIGKSNQASP